MDAGSSRLISVVTPEPGLVSWEFGMDGTLTTPGNIITGNVIFADGTVSTGGVTYAAANASVQMISNNAYNQVRVDDTNVEIYTSVNGVTQQQWTFDNAGTVTFPTGGNLTFDSSAVSTIDGITNISATGTVGANVIQVLDSITSFGASPAPVIYGFRSIATTGSAVNEGNISASGNLVASQNAYITGNLIVYGNATVSNIAYTPTTSSDWSAPAPTTIGQAIDRLAAVVKALNNGTGA